MNARPINTRDVHIAVILDGQDTPTLYRRRNPQAVAWERYAHKMGYDAQKAGMLALTYQAWVAARPGVKFDDWEQTVDEVYPASPDGVRLEVDGRWLLDEEIINLEGQLKDKATPAAG